MFKLDKVKSLFDCDQCHQLIVEPVTIPCGNSVCKTHLDSHQKNFTCELCREEHTVPEKGFNVNKRIQMALDIQLNTLTLDPKYDQFKKKLEEAKQTFAEVESTTKDPESFVYIYFEEIKREIDLRREELKAEIDEYSNELIEEVESTKLDLMSKSKQVDRHTELVIGSKQELDSLIRRFDNFEFNDKKFEEIKTVPGGLQQKLDAMLVAYRESLLENKEYIFRYDNKSIGEIFGSFQVSRDSKLVIFYYYQTVLLIPKMCNWD